MKGSLAGVFMTANAYALHPDSVKVKIWWIE